MIVNFKNKEYIVFYMFFCREKNGDRCHHMWCWDIVKESLNCIDFFDTEIVDGRLPPEMCIHKKQNLNGSTHVAVLEHDKIFKESSWFWEAFDNDDPKARLLFHKVINEMKEFHGLPTDDLSELEKEVSREEIVQKPITEKERRTNAIETELEEYLRLGEEE